MKIFFSLRRNNVMSRCLHALEQNIKNIKNKSPKLYLAEDMV
jgi:hypothetical protein